MMMWSEAPGHRGRTLSVAAVGEWRNAATVGLADSCRPVGAASPVRPVDTLDPIVPETVKTFVTDLLIDAGDRVGSGSVWLVLGSVTIAIFFGSRAVVALQKSIAEVEERTERRPAFQMRLVAMGLTLAGGVALVATSVLLVTGRQLVEFVAELIGNELVLDLWTWLRIPMAAAGLYLFLTALYRFGPPEPLPRAWLAALVGTAGAVLGSLGFGLYLGASPELGATFGVLGAVAIALVWLYVGAMAILLGAVTVSYLTNNGDASSREVRPGEGGGS